MLTLLSLMVLSSPSAHADFCKSFEVCDNNIDDDCDGKIDEGCRGTGGGLGGGGGIELPVAPVGPGPSDFYPIGDLFITARSASGTTQGMFSSAVAARGAGASCLMDLSSGLPERDMSFEELCGHAGAALIEGDAAHDIAMGAAAASDLDGDGEAEWFIGSAFNDASSLGETGVVYSLGGGLSGEYAMPGDARSTIQGLTDGSMTGWTLLGGQDFDGDGSQDLVISAPQEGWVYGDGGAVYLLSGGTTSATSVRDANTAFFGEAREDGLGGAVAAADLDGDGLANLIIGASGSDVGATDGGAVTIITDANGWQWVGDAGHTLVGTYADGFAGVSVAAAGDVDGDGYEDALAGSPGAGGDYGVAYLISGGRGFSAGDISSLREHAEMLIGDRGDTAGVAVSGAGDVDEDGRADVWVGAPGNNGDTGVAYLVLGADLSGPGGYLYLSREASAFIEGDDAGDAMGAGVQGDTDINSDGYPDLLLFAAGATGASGEAGVLYFGQTSPVSTESRGSSSRE
ncbi:MAG: FG-GAP repeat protein [Alphaproteobacteria bacterium]|nr:FG-GAP repeat protein [Alphaproteobacteria bacterium]